MVESLLNTGEALGSTPSTARRKQSFAAVDHVGVPTSSDKCPMETQSAKAGCSSKIAISRLAWARVRPLLHTHTHTHRGIEEGLCRGTEKYVAYKRGHVTMNLESLQLERLEPYQATRGRNRLPTKASEGACNSLHFCCFETGSHNVALAVLKLATLLLAIDKHHAWMLCFLRQVFFFFFSPGWP